MIALAMAPPCSSSSSRVMNLHFGKTVVLTTRCMSCSYPSFVRLKLGDWYAVGADADGILPVDGVRSVNWWGSLLIPLAEAGVPGTQAPRDETIDPPLVSSIVFTGKMYLDWREVFGDDKIWLGCGEPVLEFIVLPTTWWFCSKKTEDGGRQQWVLMRSIQVTHHSVSWCQEKKLGLTAYRQTAPDFRGCASRVSRSTHRLFDWSNGWESLGSSPFRLVFDYWRFGW